jgi:long-chain acyl-CoA synthetase
MRISSIINRAIQISGSAIATDYLDRQRNWREFGDRTTRLAGALVELGVVPGERVAMLSLNSDRYLEYFFAVPWAGAVFVPINTRLAPPEIVYWLSDSGSTVLFVDDAFTDVWLSIAQKVPSIHTVIYTGENQTPDGMLAYEALLAQAAPIEPKDRGGDEMAGIFYTGGTTGRSKGVMLSHQNILSSAVQFSSEAGFHKSSNYLHAAPMFHVANGVGLFGVALVAGRNTIITAFEPAAVLREPSRREEPRSF